MAANELSQALERAGYYAERDLAVTLFLALELGRPLLVEGDPGVGKTEIAKALARAHGYPLIRLQCYEGLDETKALYEWNYQRQLLKLQIMHGKETPDLETDLFSEEYLLERPLLQAIRAREKTVLLIDEVDKADAEFESFLFEVLSDFQVSIPELGTIPAVCIPAVILTSNAERELSEGLKRRCLYYHLEFPDVERETRILRAKVPEAGEALAREVALAAAYLRSLALRKKPSIAESLDWAKGLGVLGVTHLDEAAVRDTIGLVLKNVGDLETVKEAGGISRMVSGAVK